MHISLFSLGFTIILPAMGATPTHHILLVRLLSELRNSHVTNQISCTKQITVSRFTGVCVFLGLYIVVQYSISLSKNSLCSYERYMFNKVRGGGESDKNFFKKENRENECICVCSEGGGTYVRDTSGTKRYYQFTNDNTITTHSRKFHLFTALQRLGIAKKLINLIRSE